MQYAFIIKIMINNKNVCARQRYSAHKDSSNYLFSLRHNLLYKCNTVKNE